MFIRLRDYFSKLGLNRNKPDPLAGRPDITAAIMLEFQKGREEDQQKRFLDEAIAKLTR